MGSLPEPAYLTEIPKLKKYPNIKTLGYVATNYTDKALDSVLAEIWQWTSWPILMNDTRMAVDGIFFDEIPGLYHWQKHDYLTTATRAVRSSEHLGERIIGASTDNTMGSYSTPFLILTGYSAQSGHTSRPRMELS